MNIPSFRKSNIFFIAVFIFGTLINCQGEEATGSTLGTVLPITGVAGYLIFTVCLSCCVFCYFFIPCHCLVNCLGFFLSMVIKEDRIDNLKVSYTSYSGPKRSRRERRNGTSRGKYTNHNHDGVEVIEFRAFMFCMMCLLVLLVVFMALIPMITAVPVNVMLLLPPILQAVLCLLTLVLCIPFTLCSCHMCFARGYRLRKKVQERREASSSGDDSTTSENSVTVVHPTYDNTSTEMKVSEHPPPPIDTHDNMSSFTPSFSQPVIGGYTVSNTQPPPAMDPSVGMGMNNPPMGNLGMNHPVGMGMNNPPMGNLGMMNMQVNQQGNNMMMMNGSGGNLGPPGMGGGGMMPMDMGNQGN